MTISHLLEDFSKSDGSQGPLKLMSQEELEDIRLASFEQGYSAGWDDSIKAQDAEQKRINTHLGKRLEDLSFTYHEALNQMTQAVEPVLRSLTETVLPQVLRQTLGEHIVEELTKLAHTHANQPATIHVPPGMRAMLDDLISGEFSMPVAVIEDDSMVPDTATLRIGASETDINCTDLLTSISERIDAFYYQINKEAVND